jgi:hypothetical protein
MTQTAASECPAPTAETTKTRVITWSLATTVTLETPLIDVSNLNANDSQIGKREGAGAADLKGEPRGDEIPRNCLRGADVDTELWFRNRNTIQNHRSSNLLHG